MTIEPEDLAPIKEALYNEIKYVMDLMRKHPTDITLGASCTAIYRCLDIVDSFCSDEAAEREKAIQDGRNS